MTGDSRGAVLADHFTRGNADEVKLFGGELESLGVKTRTRAITGGEGGPPFLDGEGVMYVLRCKVLDDEPLVGLVRVRDHVIVIGEVVEVVDSEGHGEEAFGLV
jgi:hypothetical protein